MGEPNSQKKAISMSDDAISETPRSPARSKDKALWTHWLFEACGHGAETVQSTIRDWLAIRVESVEEKALFCVVSNEKATRSQIIKGLIACGARADEKNQQGRTALAHLMACGLDSPSGIKALLPHVDARATDGAGNTALMWAAAMDLPECVALLMPQSDLSDEETQGWTALTCAAWAQSMDCLELLLPGSSARKTDKNGDSPLLHAAKKAWPEGLKRLLPLSDVAQRNAHGQDAFDIVVENINVFQREKIECVEILAPFVEVCRLRQAVAKLSDNDAPVARALIEREDLEATVASADAEKNSPSPIEKPNGNGARKAGRI